MKRSKEEIVRKRENWLKMLEEDYHVEVNLGHTHYYKNDIGDLASLRLSSDSKDWKKYDTTRVSVYNQDIRKSIFAARTHAPKSTDICVLNFASYYNPGGGFLKGANTQEEALCSVSGLYPILQKQGDVYEARKKRTDISSLYDDDILYSTDVPFISKSGTEAIYVDVITASAPNLSTPASNKLSKEEIKNCLLKRMELIYLLPAYNYCQVLLLGAWGCGVFKNDPADIAAIWDYLTNKYDGLYYEVCHPVLDVEQYKIFKRICK